MRANETRYLIPSNSPQRASARSSRVQQQQQQQQQPCGKNYAEK